MDFKNMLSRLSQLNESKDSETLAEREFHDRDEFDSRAEVGDTYKKGNMTMTKTKGGTHVKHKSDYETDDEDDGKKKEEPAVKRGRGRPKKGADETGSVKTYKGAKQAQDVMIGKLPKGKLPGKPGKKHSLKEWVEEIENKYVGEALAVGQKPIPVVGKVGDTQQTGAGFLNINDTSPAGQAIQKALSDLAQQKKAQIVVPTTPGQTTTPAAGATGQAPVGQQQVKEKWAGDAKVKATGEYAGKSVAELKSMLAKLHKSGPHKRGSAEEKKMHQINFALRAKGHWKKGEGAATKSDMSEGDIPSVQGIDTMGAGLGAGRSDTTLESKKAKPDFLDIDKDGNKKESMKKAAKDKKKVDEGMDTRLKAARHTGKAHALSKQGYNCSYDDMEESRMYHEGYKEGLDECYGQVPIVGAVVDETDSVPATVGGMADQAESIVDEMDMEEGNAFTAALARTPKGGKFNVGGKTFTDRTSYDAKVDETMFESWDKELNSLLEEYNQIEEGLTVSISKGQQGAPDSVSVTAQDQEADQLLSLIKSAGLGLFGDDQAQQGPMTVDNGQPDQGDIDVVGDHDGMMALIKKVTGRAGEPDTVAIGGEEGSDDYKDEEGSEEVCDACGSQECECDSEEQQQVDEVESEDQMTYEVAEDNAPDSGAAEEEEEIQDTAQANQSAAETEIDESEEEEEETELDEGLGKMSRDMLAAASDRAAKGPKRLHPMYSAKVGGQELLAKHKKEGKVEYVPDMSKMKKEETVDESAQLDEWANEAGQKGTDAQFETDIAFMTKVIAGGLNKEKATGQTTIPVIAGQNDRMGYNNVNESIIDFKKLAGIK